MRMLADLEIVVPAEWRSGPHLTAWGRFAEWAEQNQPKLGNVQALWLGFRAGWMLRGAPGSRPKKAKKRSKG